MSEFPFQIFEQESKISTQKFKKKTSLFYVFFAKVKQIKVLKRESKKTDSSKIPTLLNVDPNQEKQVKLVSMASTKECCFESLAHI